ncbi:hypothetical protein EON81_01690 [bacterium]|nr:MAG: hypothetical protein EON81_01690 [bacterium]
MELTSNPLQSFAWTAVSFPEENFVWFSLKNPRILRSTILWFSNAGRDHAPWNGRHRGVMGLEEVTAEFNFGLAESVEAGAVLELSTLPSVSVLMGVVDTPSGMGRVTSISPVDGGLSIVDESGREATVSCDLGWLNG